MSSRKSKRQGTIEPPSGVIQTRRQNVMVGRKTMVITEYDTERSTTIYIGSDQIYCIDMTLSKDIGDIYKPRGFLTKIRWDGECSINDPFEKGTDTIMILKLAMTYVHRNYPTVKHMIFTDMSTRQCDNGASVSLSGMKIFTEGKTWYETQFHAVLDPDYQSAYDAMMRYATELKGALPWDTFVYDTVNNATLLGIDQIKQTYESSDTWQEFFRYVRSQLGVAAFCVCLSEKGWFDNFIQTRLRFHLMSVQYLIDPSLYDIDYTLTPVKGGRVKGIQRWKHTLRKQK